MAKLTKLEAKAHAEAVLLLESDTLTNDEKEFIQLNWQESANHVNSTAGAFFTPPDMAHDAALDVGRCGRVIDLCAGIGTLSLAVWQRQAWERGNGETPIEIVCIELNPAYVEIGKKMLPEATWICGSIFDLPNLGHFDTAISNPPFGNIKTGGGEKGQYTGSKFEYRTIEIASQLADFGVFIIPQQSAGFRFSGARYYERQENREYLRFVEQTGIQLEAGAGVDTSIYREQWHGVAPQVEIACADFTEIPSRQLAPVAELPTIGIEQMSFDFEEEATA